MALLKRERSPEPPASPDLVVLDDVAPPAPKKPRLRPWDGPTLNPPSFNHRLASLPNTYEALGARIHANMDRDAHAAGIERRKRLLVVIDLLEAEKKCPDTALALASYKRELATLPDGPKISGRRMELTPHRTRLVAADTFADLVHELTKSLLLVDAFVAASSPDVADLDRIQKTLEDALRYAATHSEAYRKA